MGQEIDITELEELNAKKVSGVNSPANGTPWLLMKAAEQHGSLQGMPDDNYASEGIPAGIPNPEDEEREMEMITKATDALCLLHDYAVKGVCTEEDLDAVQKFLDAINEEQPIAVEKAKLNAKRRNALPDSAFAYIDSKGGRHLPIYDASHVRNALSRFNQTHFESESKKKEAARKIHAKAKEFGIDTSKDDEVNKAAGFTSTGVPTATNPTLAGSIDTASHSQLAGALTAGQSPPVPPADSLGGRSTYNIPDEKNITNPKKTKKIPGEKRKAKKSKSKEPWSIEVIDRISKEGTNWAISENATPSTSATSTPGNPVWEKYDSATLDSVARGLTAAIRATETIRKRETIEGVSGDPGDFLDAFKLDCALDDLTEALSFIAPLAYHEAEAANKSLDLSDLSKFMNPSSHSSLDDEQGNALKGKKTSEEEEIMTTVAKEDLGKLIAKNSKNALSELLKEQEKKNKKVAKAEAKKAAKAAKKAVEAAANNKGNVDSADLSGSSSGSTDDVRSKQKKVKSEYVGKGKQAKRLEKDLSFIKETVEKMSTRPRVGGPVLDGQPRGIFSPTQGRMSEPVAKEADVHIETLKKQLELATDAQQREVLGQQISYLQLVRGHEQGLI